MDYERIDYERIKKCVIAYKTFWLLFENFSIELGVDRT